MSLQTRKHKINQVAQSDATRLVYERNKFHKTYHVDSVRTGEPFQVIFNWSKNGTLVLEAELFSFSQQEHPANRSHTVCYQVLGSAKKMARENGKTLSVCKDYQSAKRLLRLGGELVKIVNKSHNGVVWSVVK